MGIIRKLRCRLGLLKRNILAAEAYRRVKKQKHSDTAVFIAFPHVGDIVFILAYVKEFRRQNPGKRIIAVTTENLAWLTNTYEGIDEVVVVRGGFDKKIMNAYVDSLKYATKGLGYAVYSIIFGAEDVEHCHDNVLYALRNYVLKIDDDSREQFHNVTPAAVTSVPSADLPRTIVLNEYSGSMKLRGGGISRESLRLSYRARLCGVLQCRG